MKISRGPKKYKQKVQHQPYRKMGSGALLVAAVVAMLSRLLAIPYSVGLVLTGIVLALLPLTPKIDLTRELIFDALLPLLIFEAPFYLRWGELRREIPVVLTRSAADRGRCHLHEHLHLLRQAAEPI